MSLRIQTMLLMNFLVIMLVLILGWAAGQSAGRAAEQRLIEETVRNTGRFLEKRQLPLTDTVLRYLSEIFEVQFAVVDPADHRIIASSQEPDQIIALRRAAGKGPVPGAFAANGESFRIGRYQIDQRLSSPVPAKPLELLAMVRVQRFREARRDAALGVAVWLLPSLIVSTVLACVFSMALAHPLRSLAVKMDRLASDAASLHPEALNSNPLPALVPRSASRGPDEIRQLAHSFEQLVVRLNSALRQLLDAQKLAVIGKLALSVAHEIRNPLSGIKMNIRVLQDQLTAGEGDDETVEVLHREVERIDLYVAELMELSESSAAADDEVFPVVRDADVELAVVADSVIRLISARCRHSGIRIIRDYAGGGTLVSADSRRLRQVVLNLAINGIESMPRGGQLTFSVCETDSGLCRLSVKDTGSGVPESHGHAIFEPFVSTKDNGAGLGLYISKRIIAAHGGRIGFTNTDGGACFWFELDHCEPIAMQESLSVDSTLPKMAANP